MLKTSRLILRDIVAEDIEALAYRQKPEFHKHLPQAITQEDVSLFVAKAVKLNAELPRRYFYLAITLPDNHLIGDIVLHSDEEVSGIGFGLDPEFWGQGFATEALAAVVLFVQDELKISILETGADKGNIGSWCVLEKCGFTFLYERDGIKEYRLSN